MPRKYLYKGNMTVRGYVRRDLGWYLKIWRVLSPGVRQLWSTLVTIQNGVTSQNRSRFSRKSNRSAIELPVSQRFDTYSIHRTVKIIASTANVMKLMTLLQVLQSWESEPYLPCHLAVFPNPREKAPDSRLEANSDSSSSGTAAILCLQREGLTDMGFGHQRVWPSRGKLDQ